MSRIEEFLNGLEKKHLILLYISLFLGGVIIYINFNMTFMKGAYDKYQSEIIKYKKLQNKKAHMEHLKKTLYNLKEEEMRLKKEKFKLQDELNRLNNLIITSPILFIDNHSFAEILKRILYYSDKFNVKISLNISKNREEFKVYSINLYGTSNNIYNVYKFIQSVEKIKKIKNIKKVNIKTDKGVIFNMIINFWSYK